MASDELRRATWYWSTMATVFRRSLAKKRWWTVFSSQLRIQWRRRTTTNGAAGGTAATAVLHFTSTGNLRWDLAQNNQRPG
uniref:Uncharacterized protein n=1 Tax=Oryza sativa subsp. japonica TaxID=39947 RepID=Q109N7_ORYSJ|nr:hypothetical protein LOC_Os10g29159 [Oryza sativa Japonica Group]